MKINKKLFVFLSVISTLSVANAEVIGGTDMLKQNADTPLQRQDPQSGQTINNNQPNLVFPIDNKLKNKTPAIKQKEFQLTINPNAVKEVRKQKNIYENLMTNTEIDYLIDPERRVLRDIDLMDIHPQFITTVTFPSQVKILGAKSSSPMKLLQAEQNVLIIQPEATFRNGNIFITYRSNTKNYTMNLLVKSFGTSNDALKVSYQYVWDNDGRIDFAGILKRYIDLNGEEKVAKNFRKVGDYDTITLNEKTYYIIKDNGSGSRNYVDYKDHRFKISTRYEFENKSAKDRGEKTYKVVEIKKGEKDDNR